MVFVAFSVCNSVVTLVNKSSFYLDVILLYVVNRHSCIFNLNLRRFLQLNNRFTKYKSRIMNLYIQSSGIAQLKFNLEFIKMCIEPGCDTERFRCHFNYRFTPQKRKQTIEKATTFPQE